MTLKNIFFLLCLILCAGALAAEEISVNLEYPAFKGDFYASGKITLPPGKVLSESGIAVKNGATGGETAALVTVRKKWPDGSVMSAEIVFAANASEKTEYKIAFGPGVSAKKRFSEPAVLPNIAFSLAGSPKSAENMDMAVGQINVRVDRSPNIRYYWHIAPITVLIFVVCYRSARARRKRFYEI